MKMRLNMFFIGTVFAGLLAGCTLQESAKVSASVDQNFVKAYEAFEMAKDVLNGILASHVDNNYPISDPTYKGGYPIEVSPKVAFAIELRKARAGHSQKEVASKAGMTYQQYQRLENPHKTNPTLETLYKLQKVFNRRFLAL